MKKLSKLMALALASIGCVSGMAGCFGNVIDEVPEGRTEIKISLLSGGYGNEWLENLMNRANNAQETYWFTKIGDNKYTAEEITMRIQGGIIEADIYIVNDFADGLIAGDYCEDLTSVYESKATASDKKTIKERSLDYERYAQRAGKNGKIYALPYIFSMSGIIYDHDLFTTMGWLATDSTTTNGLTKGADGVEGTYDDGLPVTYSDFLALIDMIRGANMIPFIRADSLGWDQYRATLEPIWASYEGVESYKTSFTYNGTYTSPKTGVKTTITPETGYKMYTENLTEGREQAMKFFNEVYLKDDLANFYGETGLKHTDAQAHYVTSHAMQNQIAMLLDGEWWENEAKRIFAEDARENGDEYAYGKRDFRFMPLPAMDGQATESNGKHYFKSGASGTVFVYKQKDEGKKNAIFDFLRMYASEENCINYTKCNGSIMPYEYTISDELKNTLSKFTKNMLEIRNDPSTIAVDYANLEYQSPFVNPPERWEDIKIGTKTYATPLRLFTESETTIAEYLQAVCGQYNEGNWSTIK